MLIGWLAKKVVSNISWQSVAMGAAAATVGPAMVRPALVSLVRAGLTVQDLAGSVCREALRIKDEAATQHAASQSTLTLQQEVEQLRGELASVKAELQNAKAA
jgi:hypothetical protein